MQEAESDRASPERMAAAGEHTQLPANKRQRPGDPQDTEPVQVRLGIGRLQKLDRDIGSMAISTTMPWAETLQQLGRRILHSEAEGHYILLMGGSEMDQQLLQQMGPCTSHRSAGCGCRRHPDGSHNHPQTERTRPNGNHLDHGPQPTLGRGQPLCITSTILIKHLPSR